MRVVIVNHSDSKGGASIAAWRLLQALRDRGVDARMLVMDKTRDTGLVETAGSAWRRKACFLDEHLQIYLRNGLSRKRLFQASIATCGMPLHRHPWIQQADVVNLHWVNQGMLSLDEVARIQAPVVWTMHDMWCLTGVCHHAGECIGYTGRCGRCRLMHGGSSDNDLSRATWLRKQRLYSRCPITFVPVSRWLEQKCRHSSLLRDADIETIPNAFPVEDFSPTPVLGRAALGLPEGRKLVVMGAARLDDPIKGLDIAVDALNQITDTGAAAVFFGAMRDGHALDGLRLPHVSLGPLSDPAVIRDVYAHAHAVLSTSHYETLPTTLIEGMASGAVPVTFGRGGQSDIVDHMATGYIAQYPKPEDIADGLRYALAGRFDPERMRRSVTERFSAAAVADRYIRLFNRLTGRDETNTPAPAPASAVPPKQ